MLPFFPDKQLVPQLLLQLAKPIGECGLGDIKGFRCLVHASGLGNREEPFYLLVIHGGPVLSQG